LVVGWFRIFEAKTKNNVLGCVG